MAEFIKTQNSFAHGAVDTEFYARDNINGLSCLENMDVLSGGGLSRRAGLRSVADLPGVARLVTFSVSNDAEYILALLDNHLHIYHHGTRIQDIITPWSFADTELLQYAQRFSTMIFVHPDHCPQVLYRQDGRFYIKEFTFERNDTDLSVRIPFVRFDDSADIKITVSTHSSGNNYARFTTNRDFWTPDNLDSRLYLLDRQWTIQEYISPTEVVAYTNGTYSIPSAAVTDWRESAFGARRGWPRSITFHQDRLVFGGSRDWPGGIWMSQVGRHYNFDTGTGLDDQAIFISLLSAQRQQICTVVSSDNLQILTNVGEWAISNKPLTPSSVDIKQHTSVGSYSARYLPPQKIEGATTFISGNGRDIRELCLDELGENYNARDLCSLSKHLIGDPMDTAYNGTTHQLFIVRTDGQMAVLNQNSALGISAWGTYRTSGRFISVAVCDGVTYSVVERDGMFCLECFDQTVFQDAGKYPYSFTASGLPLRTSGHSATRLKVRKVVARVLNTKALHINTQRVVFPDNIQDAASPGFSGDVSVSLLGTTTNCVSPIWTIHGTESAPVTVLSVSTHGWYTV